MAVKSLGVWLNGERIAELRGGKPGRITPENIELSPLYDTVPTMLWPRLRTEAAMRIGTRSNLATVTIEDVLAEANSWVLGFTASRQDVIAIADRVHEVLRTDSVEVDTPALTAISERTAAFLRPA